MLLPERTQEGIRKGPWMEEEDMRLATFVRLMGEKRWDSIARVSGLRRTGKSCRLRWMNYLRPDLKRGRMTLQEEDLVLELHARWGNKWSRIASKLPGRTDNEIKNYWRTHIRRISQEQGDHSSPPQSSSSSSLFSPSSCKQPQTRSNEKNEIPSKYENPLKSQVPSLDDTHNCFDASFQPELRIEECYHAISPFECGTSGWISGLMSNHQDYNGDEYYLDPLWSL